MHRTISYSQCSLDDFDQPMGLHMNPDNQWVRLAQLIPWQEYEKHYAKHFKSHKGNVVKPFRMALCALIIKKKRGFSDRELVEEITENPYLQFFIGLPGYQEKPPFEASSLVVFRRRTGSDVSMVLNDTALRMKTAAVH